VTAKLRFAKLQIEICTHESVSQLTLNMYNWSES